MQLWLIFIYLYDYFSAFSREEAIGGGRVNQRKMKMQEQGFSLLFNLPRFSEPEHLPVPQPRVLPPGQLGPSWG